MTAQIISIGSELVVGQTIDTNAAWLSQRLAGLGIQCTKHVTVADDPARIREVIIAAARKTDLVLITGGLGPTPDDVTRDAIADALGCELRLDPHCLEQIRAYFHRRKRHMHGQNRRQAMIPESAEAIENRHGTAPGIRARLHNADLFCLPGVPDEMQAMFDASIRPRLTSGAAGGVIRQRLLQTFGMSEAEVGEKLADLMRAGRNPIAGTSAAELIITVRLQARADRIAEADRFLTADAAEVRSRLETAVFGEGVDTLADAVARLLTEQHATIATAESCTGGLVAKCLTDVSGSSAYMVQGFVTYANEAKRDLLDVSAGLIESHGAVSREVAEAMATNCRRVSRTDYAISTTGIAGPAGGTSAKPVGLVYVGLATPRATQVKELRLGERLTRTQVRDRTAKVALNLLRLALVESAGSE